MIRAFTALLCFFLASATARAQDCVECSVKITQLPQIEESVRQLAKKAVKIGWFSANEEQIKNAKCTKPEKDSIASMEAYLDSFDSGKLVKQNIHGLELEDEPHKLELLRKLLTVLRDGRIEQKSFSNPPGCKKVKCAAEAIFEKGGKGNATMHLYALDKYGANFSHLREKGSQMWKASEMEIMLEGLDDLPSSLFPFETNTKVLRDGSSNGRNMANSSITFFEGYTKKSKVMRGYLMVHEFAHRGADLQSLDKSPEWLALSGWEIINGKWVAGNPDKVPSEYGREAPGEDFAETFTAYRYNPELLKTIAPDKYSYMKNYIFQGLEFDKEENCQEDQAYINRAVAGNGDHDPKYSACRQEAISFLGGRASKEKMRRCIARSNAVEGIEKLSFDAVDGIDIKQVKKGMIEFGTYAGKKALPSDAMVREGYMRMADDFIQTFAHRYSNYDEKCSELTHGWNNFNPLFRDKLADPLIAYNNREVLDQLNLKICEQFPGVWKINPKDPKLKKIFYDMIPF